LRKKLFHLACHMYNCTYPRKVVPPACLGGGGGAPLTHKKRGPTSQVRKTPSTHWKERQTMIRKGGQKHIKRGANYRWEEGPTTNRKGGGARNTLKGGANYIWEEGGQPQIRKRDATHQNETQTIHM
jgi:hypothetical protein